tara:strand:+ start:1033 stop:2019 length:987 start_codon:yes stop_codon:yes gene_type:complete
MKKIILVGGAGYIGTVLTKHLLEKEYKVICIDNLIYKQDECIKQFVQNKNFEFVNIDIRKKDVLGKYFFDAHSVVLLAGLVGDPITKKYPEMNDEINIKGILNVVEICKEKNIERLIFTSTCSNYGITDKDVIADENNELKPLSLYASAKVYIENFLMSLNRNSSLKPTILRFATAFGLSPRMRFDLTVNEFTKEMALGNELVIYDANTWRPYCHTEDFAYLICKVIEADIAKIAFEIFNVGDNENNFTKQMIVDEILKFYPNGKVKYLEKGVDQRNYIVDFSKVNSVLNFKSKYSISKGIDELIFQINNKKFDFKSENQFGNYNLNL